MHHPVTVATGGSSALGFAILYDLQVSPKLGMENPKPSGRLTSGSIRHTLVAQWLEQLPYKL